jgi:hypothetical protein
LPRVAPYCARNGVRGTWITCRRLLCTPDAHTRDLRRAMSELGLGRATIHPSGWKVNSPTFACVVFPEVQLPLYGVLRGSHVLYSGKSDDSRISLLRSSTLPGSLPDQPMIWNEIQVPPPPTTAPSASSTGAWRPSSSLAQNTSGRSAKAGQPHAPNT